MSKSPHHPSSAVLILLLAMLFPFATPAAEDAHRLQRIEMTRNALEYLAEWVKDDGSVGDSHRRLQTGLTVLAFLSAGRTPRDARYGDVVERGGHWLLRNRAVTGFMGDRELPAESHAVAALAVAQLDGEMGDTVADRKLHEAAREALEYTLDKQDRAFGGRYNGGWKAEPRAQVNDRKASAWQLTFIQSMRRCGLHVSKSALLRGAEFMSGSFKGDPERHAKYDLGGFSYDAEGLPVRSISAAGLYCMEQFGRPAANRAMAARWLSNNPAVWTGPHFYYTQFFAVRALRLHSFSSGTEEARERYENYVRGVTRLLHDRQHPDGSFGLPPGNAEYTKQMGPTYGAAMAVLILNADRNLLPLDVIPEFARPQPTQTAEQKGR
jgi:hypothetical protein